MRAASKTPGPDEAGREARERADREAVSWLILLQDDPGNAEHRARFETWLSAEPAHVAAWAGVQLAAGLIDVVPPVHQDAWAERRGASPIEARPGRLPWRRRSAGGRSVSPVGRWDRRVLAVALGAAACVVVFAAPSVSLRLQSDFVSGVGGVQTVRLEDGSEMHLAPGSAVKLAYSEGRRGVRLLKGQAYFEVQPDPARRFKVEAGGVETTVLGTGFEVRRDRGGADVAVRHGLVQVDNVQGRAPVSVRLSPGDRVNVTTAGGVLSRERPERVASWTQGDLIVTDETVRDVVEALRPWHGGVILMTGPGLDVKRVTGVYDLRHPKAALTSLAEVHDLKLRQISPWITVVSAD
jgi:transmembrane sensor